MEHERLARDDSRFQNLFSIHLGTDFATGDAVGYKPKAKNVALIFFAISNILRGWKVKGWMSGE